MANIKCDCCSKIIVKTVFCGAGCRVRAHRSKGKAPVKEAEVFDEYVPQVRDCLMCGGHKSMIEEGSVFVCKRKGCKNRYEE